MKSSSTLIVLHCNEGKPKSSKTKTTNSLGTTATVIVAGQLTLLLMIYLLLFVDVIVAASSSGINTCNSNYKSIRQELVDRFHLHDHDSTNNDVSSTEKEVDVGRDIVTHSEAGIVFDYDNVRIRTMNGCTMGQTTMDCLMEHTNTPTTNKTTNVTTNSTNVMNGESEIEVPVVVNNNKDMDINMNMNMNMNMSNISYDNEADILLTPTNYDQSIIGEVSSTMSSPSLQTDHSVLSSCRVYLAESTIPGAGLGVFAGTEFHEDDDISIVGDAVIPLEYIHDTSLLKEYVWSDSKSTVFAVGIAGIPNCFFPLINVDYHRSANQQTDIDGNEFISSYNPGVGSTTVDYQSGGYATRYIYSGEELFVGYGEGYFSSRAKFGKIPFDRHYRMADKLLHLYRNNVNSIVLNQERRQCPLNNRTDTDAQDPPTLERSSTVPLVPLAIDLYEIVKFVILAWPGNIQGAMPSEVSGINHLLDTGAKTTAMNFHRRSIRSIEEMQAIGSCMDHLVAGASTIPYAGRGAFANKFLPAGTTVAPIPLLHMSDRSVLTVYAEDDYGRKNRAHYQLLMNYCFGHKDVTVVLCPYGIATSLVNHAPTGEANVRLGWSTKLTREPGWLNMSTDEWKHEFHAGLTLEYVALRDIKEGEEVLFDYGTEWQQAWDEYVQNVFPTTSQYLYQTINEQYPPIEIPKGNDGWPWGQSVALWCRTLFLVLNEGFHMTDIYDDTPPFHPCRVVATSIDAETNETLYTAELYIRIYSDNEDRLLQQKVASNQNTAQGNITVDDTCSEINAGNVMFNVPRDTFVVANLRLDELKNEPIHKEGWTFRHPIGLPDSIVPDVWKTEIGQV